MGRRLKERRISRTRQAIRLSSDLPFRQNKNGLISRDEAVRFPESSSRPPSLNAERRAAAAGAFHVRIFKLEARAFESLDIIDDAAIQIHDRSGIDEALESIHFEGLVHHSGAVLKLHRIGETGASATYHSDAQAGGNGGLLAHNLFHLGDSIWG